MTKLHVGLVGLGFGAEFLPIYLHHPQVEHVTVFDGNPDIIQKMQQQFRGMDVAPSFEALLGDSSIDAIHLVTPIPLHAQQSVAVLGAGKHCACTVPMATTLDDLRAILTAQRKSGRHYMMMETAVYTREFFYAADLVQSGQLGRIQFLRGAHYQDMAGWPPYWAGLPPMHYGTHAISPLLALSKSRAKRVHCFGSGSMSETLQKQYQNPYPVETAIFQLEAENLAAEVTRTLFETARPYTESFSVYGDQAGFEWQQIESESPLVYRLGDLERARGRSLSTERLEVPDRADKLPPEIARFTTRSVYESDVSHLSFLQGGGHGGSHPHLIHEFVSAITENRSPWPDAVTAAHWTAAGICAHQSAMNGGAATEVPDLSTELVLA
jgi:predicted dehydrogenase